MTSGQIIGKMDTQKQLIVPLESAGLFGDCVAGALSAEEARAMQMETEARGGAGEAAGGAEGRGRGDADGGASSWMSRKDAQKLRRRVEADIVAPKIRCYILP
jgi:hypothetical protein